MDTPGRVYTENIVGAADVLSGTAQAASGVKARGNTLVVRLTRPIADFAAATTMPFFCAVPPTPLPPSPRAFARSLRLAPMSSRSTALASG